MLKDLAQPSHLLILAVLVVVLFGWKKLPDVTRSVGRSMRIFSHTTARRDHATGAGASAEAGADAGLTGAAGPAGRADRRAA